MWFQRNKWRHGVLLIGIVLGCAPTAVFANTNIQTKICPPFEGPAIITPASNIDTEATSIAITGTGEPGMTLSIIDNGNVVGITTILMDGSYGIEVNLEAGDNTLVAREMNDCGTTKESNSVIVHRIVTEQPHEETPDGETQTEAPQAFESQAEAVTIPRTFAVIGSPIEPFFETTEFPKPTISSPLSGSTFDGAGYIWVRGRAQPKSIVTIYINDRSAAYAITSEGGTYGALVALSTGENRIQVKATLGDSVAVSESINVVYRQKESDTNSTSTAAASEVIVKVVTLIAGGAAVLGAATGCIVVAKSIIVRLSRWRR